MNYIDKYLDEAHKIIDSLDKFAINKMIDLLNTVRENNGRLFILGVGGGAGHASHAVNDFRKICGIEAYTPTDNVSELTARVNDDGWETTYVNWLKISKLNKYDIHTYWSIPILVIASYLLVVVNTPRVALVASTERAIKLTS